MRLKGIVVLLCFLTPHLMAQQTHGGRGYFVFGGSFLSIDTVNSVLSSAGYPEVSGTFLSFGGAGYGVWNKFLFGGEGHWLKTNKESTENKTTSVSSSYGMFDLGYIFLHNPNYELYPLLGIGGGKLTTVMEDNTGNKTTVSVNQFLLSIGIGFDYFFPTSESGAVVLGLKAGYLFPPLKGKTTVDGDLLEDTPDFNITGPFVQVVIGGGRL